MFLIVLSTYSWQQNAGQTTAKVWQKIEGKTARESHYSRGYFVAEKQQNEQQTYGFKALVFHLILLISSLAI
jgi:hypothetical protein